MKKLFLFWLLSCFGYSLIAQESFMVSTETRYWNSSETYFGYTLFGTRGTSYLIDFEGHVLSLTSIDFATHHTLGILDADLSLGLCNTDHRSNYQKENCNHQH